MMKRNLLFVIGAFVLLYGCKKDDEPPFSVVPEISLNSLSADTIKEFQDSLSISLHYQDGDGDIGYEESDSFALYVKDIRLTEYDKFYVSPLAPFGHTIPITGSLTIPVGKLFRLGTNANENTKFKIKLIDRSGNWSNEIETETVTILQ